MDSKLWFECVAEQGIAVGNRESDADGAVCPDGVTADCALAEDETDGEVTANR